MIRFGFGLVIGLTMLSTPAFSQDTGTDTGGTQTVVDTSSEGTGESGGTGTTGDTGTATGGIIYDTGPFAPAPSVETFSAAELLGEEGGANCSNCATVSQPVSALVWVWLLGLAAVRRRSA